jgi:glycosyltransferase involved in cell wall biosynthesis
MLNSARTQFGQSLRILGTRGVPAAHGGFETFAECLSLYLVAKGWKVTVYCQETGTGPIREDCWHGVHRVKVPVGRDDAQATIIFDWKATTHAAKCRDLCLTLGYNTAVFAGLLRAYGIPNIINMDGIEWRRAKWGTLPKCWFYLNERAGCWLGNHLIADHPEIKRHLATRVSERKITMIPYGADLIESAPEHLVAALGLEPGRYLSLIARAEPENSVLEIVRAFSRKRRGLTLAVLGQYDPLKHTYQRAVVSSASEEVRFLGAIYDKTLVQALRFHSVVYVHGHQVGGTNPSLVEALGASNAVLAHDNPFNRWVAGDSARYFTDTDSCADQLDRLLSCEVLRASMKAASRARFREAFTWSDVLDQYERVLVRSLAAQQT